MEIDKPVSLRALALWAFSTPNVFPVFSTSLFPSLGPRWVLAAGMPGPSAGPAEVRRVTSPLCASMSPLGLGVSPQAVELLSPPRCPLFHPRCPFSASVLCHNPEAPLLWLQVSPLSWQGQSLLCFFLISVLAVPAHLSFGMNFGINSSGSEKMAMC